MFMVPCGGDVYVSVLVGNLWQTCDKYLFIYLFLSCSVLIDILFCHYAVKDALINTSISHAHTRALRPRK